MITTKTGDSGQTTCGNKRVDKDDLLVEVIGTIDELQSSLGVVKVSNHYLEIKSLMERLQKDMHKLSGELACDVIYDDLKNRVGEIEEEINKMEKELPPMKEFLIPGVNIIEAQIHVCRTVCRRAERRLAALNKTQKINEEILKYFNRLSDYLFLLARRMGQQKS